MSHDGDISTSIWGGTGLEYATGTLADSEILNCAMYVISRIVSHFAVPLFFLMSSVLLYRKEFTWISNVKRKIKTLIIPYIIWVTIYIAIYYVGQAVPATAVYFANPNRIVKNMSLLDFIGAYTGFIGKGLFVNAIWFLRDLIVFNLLSLIIKRLVDTFPSLVLALLGILWICAPSDTFLGFSPQGVVFFTLGYYVVKYGKRFNSVDQISWWQISIAYIVAVVVEFKIFLNGETTNLMYGVSTIIGITLLLIISGKIIDCDIKPIPRVLSIIADYSFFVYASHDFVQTIVKKISEKVLPGNDVVRMIEYLSIPIIVCGLCICIAKLIKKSLPKVYEIMTGSRKQITSF